MSKRKNKSRLTKTDVNAICEMQRKIDAYEDLIMGLCGYIQHEADKKYVVILKGTDMDEWVISAWQKFTELMKELRILKEGA